MSRRRRERLDRLQDALAAQSVLRLREAAGLLGVSEMTVRRDIAECAGQFAYLGGYIVGGREPLGGSGYVFAEEIASHAPAKRKACARAAQLIEEGDTVFIDCGTTLPHLASRIPPELSVTVVCYAMNIAEIVCKRPNLSVILLGGLYHASSASFSSSEAMAMLERIGLNKAFLSAGGLHPAQGVSCSNFHEVPIKRAAMAKALKRYLVADASKVGKVKSAFFGELSEFDGFVTDAGLSPADRAALEATGLPVLQPQA